MEILRKLRFETLPLSLSGVILGILLAAADYMVDWKVAVALLAATSLLHLSINAGKYGKEDGQMWKVSQLFLALTIICGVLTVYFTFGTLLLMESFVVMLLGYVIIRTARHSDFFNATQTLSRKLVPVLLLTALVPIYGSYYICSHSFGTWLLLLPSLAVGALNLAIVREGAVLEVDKEATYSFKIVQFLLIMVSWLAMTAFTLLRVYDIWHYLFVASMPLFVAYRIVFMKNGSAHKQISFKLLLASSLLFSTMGGLGYVIFLLW